MFCRPAYRMTRLNGIPSQMFAMTTATMEVSGEVSQLIWPMPNALSAEFTMPLSLLSIHDQVEAETMSGSSHGTRKRARSTLDSGKLERKKTARASPRVYWKTMETTTKTAVFQRAAVNSPDWTMAR
jgi:hypothetical protein